MIQVNATTDIPIKGMIFALLAFFSFAIMNMFAKLLGDTFHAVELVFWRNLICILPMAGYIYFSNQKNLFVPQKPVAVAFRAIIGTISLGLTLATFIVLPMADATAFVFTSALLVPIASYFVLKEKVGKYRLLAIGIGFIGILVMVNPTGAVNMTGVTLAMLTAISHAILQIHLRYLGKVENPLTTAFYFFVGGTIMGGAAMPFIGHVPQFVDVLPLLGLGASGLIGQILLTNAFKFAEASVVTIFNYSGIIWATLLGWFVFNDWPTSNIFIGAAIVIGCNLFIFWRESRLKKSPMPFTGSEAH